MKVPRARLHPAVFRSDSTTPWLIVLSTVQWSRVMESSIPRWKRVEQCHRTDSSLGPRPPKHKPVCWKALLLTRLDVNVIGSSHLPALILVQLPLLPSRINGLMLPKAFGLDGLCFQKTCLPQHLLSVSRHAQAACKTSTLTLM